MENFSRPFLSILETVNTKVIDFGTI